MSFSRDQYEKLSNSLGQDQITIILGARQVGKSYLMEKLRKKVTGEKFFDLEDPETIKNFHGDNEHIFQILDQAKAYIFIDEFQYIENISQVFKAIYDRGQRNNGKKIKIFASGSSSLEIHKHLKESLAGRKKEIIVRPLLYNEYKSNDVLDDPDDYFVYGGLPGLYKFKTRHERQDYLNDIVKTYIQKDIKAFIKEQKFSAFNKLIFSLAEHQGQIISINSFANDLSIKYHEVQEFLDILEHSFVLYPLKPFSGNLSNELKKSKKYYLYDLGIRNLLVKNFSSIERRKDKGILWESYVYHYLISKQKPCNDIHYWRTSHGNEVDFIWTINRETIPIEVKSKAELSDIPNGIEKFLDAYPKSKTAVVIFAESKTIKDNYAKTEYKGHIIHFINARFLDEYLAELLEDY